MSALLSFSALGAPRSELSPQDKAAQLVPIIRVAPGRFPRLEEARREFLRGNTAAANRALKAFIDGDPRTTAELSRQARHARASAVSRGTLLRYFAEKNPKLLEKRARSMIFHLQSILSEISRQEVRSRDFMASRLSPARNGSISRATIRVHNELSSLSVHMRGAASSVQFAFQLRNHHLLYQVTRFTEALLNRHSTLEERAEAIASSIARFKATGKFEYDVNRLSALEAREGREEKIRIWVNRETVSTLAFTVALVSQVATIPFSAGVTATAIPATLAAIRTGVSYGTNAVWVTVGSLSIADRLTQSGTAAFKQPGLYLEALLIATSLPAPVKASLAPSSFYQRFMRAQDAGNYAFLVGAGMMNIWNFYHAEWLSRERDLPASEIRRRSALSIASYLFFGIKWAKYPYNPPQPAR